MSRFGEGLLDVVRGNGTEEDEHGVVDMLHHDEHNGHNLVLETHLARDQNWREIRTGQLLGRLRYGIYTLHNVYENRTAPVLGSVIVNSGTCEMTSPKSASLRSKSC